MSDDIKQKNISEKCAEILVECRYAENAGSKCVLTKNNGIIKVEPFADALEGRRQADAIEDWLFFNHEKLWEESETVNSKSGHQWRLDRIKWCIESLIGEK